MVDALLDSDLRIRLLVIFASLIAFIVPLYSDFIESIKNILIETREKKEPPEDDFPGFGPDDDPVPPHFNPAGSGVFYYLQPLFCLSRDRQHLLFTP